MIHEQLQFDRIDAIASNVASGQDAMPVCLEVHPTDFCNQSCSYCFHGGNGEDIVRRPELLSGDDYRTLFAETERLGVQEVSVSGGGEPLLSPVIPEIVDSLVKSLLRTRIVSNGNYIPESIKSNLLLAEEIRFSLDTINPEVYSRTRRVSGKLLERTIKNIRELVEQRDAAKSSLSVGATFIISPDNNHEIADFADYLLDDVGIDSVIYKHDIYSNDSVAAATEKRLQDTKNRHGSAVEVRSVVDHEDIAGACYVPYFKVALNPYGQLYSCCLGSQPGENNGKEFGSLKTAGSLEALWRQSAHIRRDMLLGAGMNCTDCNHTDQAINSKARKVALTLMETRP